MPVITLEVLSDSSNTEMATTNSEEMEQKHTHEPQLDTGALFLTDKAQKEDSKVESENNDQDKGIVKTRNEFLEYMTRNDGSVICKLCGEILQSRTHWYRHKYKLHVIQPLNPAPLFQCEQCLVYFKSRKGYIGHLASRHSEVLKDSSPVLTNAQAEAVSKEASFPAQTEIKEEPDPEMVIPKTSVLNYQSNARQISQKVENKKNCKSNKGGDNNNKPDWEKRSREEKLVADIIDRVKRECEAQGSGGARRGYTRRTTVMHT